MRRKFNSNDLSVLVADRPPTNIPEHEKEAFVAERPCRGNRVITSFPGKTQQKSVTVHGGGAKKFLRSSAVRLKQLWEDGQEDWVMLNAPLGRSYRNDLPSRHDLPKQRVRENLWRAAKTSQSSAIEVVITFRNTRTEAARSDRKSRGLNADRGSPGLPILIIPFVSLPLYRKACLRNPIATRVASW
jgi:hypothetical protein